MVKYANTYPTQQVEALIHNLMGISDVLMDHNCELSFQRHVAVENLISALNDSLNNRFETLGQVITCPVPAGSR